MQNKIIQHSIYIGTSCKLWPVSTLPRPPCMTDTNAAVVRCAVSGPSISQLGYSGQRKTGDGCIDNIAVSTAPIELLNFDIDTFRKARLWSTIFILTRDQEAYKGEIQCPVLPNQICFLTNHNKFHVADLQLLLLSSNQKQWFTGNGTSNVVFTLSHS